ncbi:MAG: hypothetical protein CMJ83_12815 [Planctomycetes bacterium]|nr:hypothetical protein [Planctomycetota bacterium]
MSDLEITIRTAQGDKKVACEVGPDYRSEEILEGLRQKWGLAADHDFVLRVVRSGRQLAPGETLGSAGVQGGDELELFPVLVAG